MRLLTCIILLYHTLTARTPEHLGVTVTGAGRQYVFTNKEAGTLHGEVNGVTTGGWQGWYINAEKVLHDHAVTVNGRTLDRSRARSVVYPDRLVRTYAGGTTETVTLLDSIDAVLVRVNRRGALLSLTPSDAFTPAGGERWTRNGRTAEFSAVSLGLFRSLLPNATLFVIAAGRDTAEMLRNGRNALAGAERLAAARRNRIAAVLERTAASFSDARLTAAYGWASVQIDALIMNQSTGGRRTKGIFAGLPWFNNYWGRDSFIALPGATYVSGNFDDARDVLLSYAAFQESDTASVHYGRIPNLATPQSVIYNTADGTPWFVRSMYEYVKYSGDTALVRELYPVLVRAMEGALRRHVDSLGFLRHGDAETWMDAVGPDGPWSPRGDRAVDVQALWHQQLMIGVFCAEHLFDYARASAWKERADRLERNFRRHFIDTARAVIHDHLNADGSPSTEVRPNQLYAMDMAIPESVRQSMVRTVLGRLTFPHGTATLDQADPNFHPRHEFAPYYVKDAAYHNGTVWTWLNGPMIYAATRYDLQDLVYPVTENSVHQMLDRGTVGALSELLDAHPSGPGAEPRLSGTYSQAWSLSEFVRAVRQDYLGISVDVPSKVLRVNPKLPRHISSFSTVQRAGNGAFAISFRTAGDSVVLRIEPSRITGVWGLNYLYVYPNGDAVSAPLDLPAGRPLTVLHVRDRLVVLTGTDTLLTRSGTPGVFLKDFSDKKYFAGLSLAAPELSRDFPVLRGPAHPLLTHAQVRARNTGARLIAAADDPAGDDAGPAGTYRYPSGAHFRPGILDITRASFSADARNLYCTLTFSSLSDPGWHPEYGFQLTLAAVAIDTGGAAQRAVGVNSGHLLPVGRGFHRLIVAGGGLRVLDSGGAVLCEYLPRPEDAKDPIGSVKDRSIEFALPLEYLGTPGPHWRFTLLIGGQDDHGGAGVGEFRAVEAETGEWHGGGKRPGDTTNVYDILDIN